MYIVLSHMFTELLIDRTSLCYRVDEAKQDRELQRETFLY